MRKLFLFDIDGTLIRTNSALMKSIVSQAIEDSGYNLNHSTQSFAGRTDLDIFSSLTNDEISDFTSIIQKYARTLTSKLTEKDVQILDGVIETLESLNRLNLNYGLLSGNFKVGAELKLKKAKLDHYFDWSISAFGEDGFNRNDLPIKAIQRIKRLNSSTTIKASDIWIIGDTARDILCAKVNGFSSIGLSTGYAPYSELKKAEPTLLFNHMLEVKEWIEKN